MSRVIHIDPKRASVVRRAVNASAKANGVCEAARLRAVHRGLALLRQGRSTALACTEACAFVRRVAAGRELLGGAA